MSVALYHAKRNSIPQKHISNRSSVSNRITVPFYVKSQNCHNNIKERRENCNPRQTYILG